jgi:hypothetical protein
MMIEPKSVLKPMYWVCILVVAMLSSAVCSAETPSAMSAARQAKLEELTGQLRLGAEYFLNRTDTKAYVEQQFEAMHSTGLTLVRICRRAFQLGRCAKGRRQLSW